VNSISIDANYPKKRKVSEFIHKPSAISFQEEGNFRERQCDNLFSDLELLSYRSVSPSYYVWMLEMSKLNYRLRDYIVLFLPNSSVHIKN
jgi:hypothetical protein